MCGKVQSQIHISECKVITEPAIVIRFGDRGGGGGQQKEADDPHS